MFTLFMGLLAAWTGFRANNARTGCVPGRSNFYTTGPYLLAHWVVHSGGNSIYAGPLLWDQTQDGLDDIYVASHSSYPSITLYRGYDTSVIWQTTDNGDAYYSTPALIDVNGDGYLDVIAGFENSGGLRCYDGVTGNRLWWNTLGLVIYSSPLAFTDDAGQPRVAVANETGVLYCVDATNGTTLWTLTGSDTCRSAPAMADVNGDGQDEIVFTTKNHIYVLNQSGNLLWDVAYGSNLTTPALADVDANPDLEIVVYDASSGQLAALQFNNNTPVWTYNVGSFLGSNDVFPPSPGVGDVNANGINDVVIHNGLTVSCVENGSLLWNTGVVNSDHILYGSPILADLDGASVMDNGALETVIPGDSSTYGVIYYIQDDGSVAWTWSNPTYSYFEIYNENALGDPDGDGWLEIVSVDYSCYAVILDGQDPFQVNEQTETGRIRAMSTPKGLVLVSPGSSRVSVDFYDPAGRLSQRLELGLRPGANLIVPDAKGVLLYTVMQQGQTLATGTLVRP